MLLCCFLTQHMKQISVWTAWIKHLLVTGYEKAHKEFVSEAATAALLAFVAAVAPVLGTIRLVWQTHFPGMRWCLEARGLFAWWFQTFNLRSHVPTMCSWSALNSEWWVTGIWSWGDDTLWQWNCSFTIDLVCWVVRGFLEFEAVSGNTGYDFVFWNIIG